MKFCFFALFCIFIPLSASAKLGETKEQCDTRYGVRQTFDNDTPDFVIYHLTLEQDVYNVWIRFKNDTATDITFFRVDQKPLSESFIQSIVREYTADDAEANRMARELLKDETLHVRLENMYIGITMLKKRLSVVAEK